MLSFRLARRPEVRLSARRNGAGFPRGVLVSSNPDKDSMAAHAADIADHPPAGRESPSPDRGRKVVGTGAADKGRSADRDRNADKGRCAAPAGGPDFRPSLQDRRKSGPRAL